MEQSKQQGQGKLAVIKASRSEAKRIGRVLGEVGYETKQLHTEQDLLDAGGDESVSVIIVEGGDQDWVLAGQLKRLYETYGAALPPVLAITVRDTQGPSWIRVLWGYPVYYFQYGYADAELRIIVDKLISAWQNR